MQAIHTLTFIDYFDMLTLKIILIFNDKIN